MEHITGNQSNQCVTRRALLKQLCALGGVSAGTALLVACGAATTTATYAKSAHINSVTTITEVYGDGQVVLQKERLSQLVKMTRRSTLTWVPGRLPTPSRVCDWLFTQAKTTS